jgi:tight adherence protein B
MPAAALWYGLCLAAASLLLVRAIGAAQEERIAVRLRTLIPPTAASPDPRTGPGDGPEDRALKRGWSWGFGSYVTAHAVAQILGFWMGFRLAGPVGAFGGVAGMSLVLESWLARRRVRVRERAEGQFRDLLVALAAGARAGLSLRRALMEAARDAEPPLRFTLERSLHRIDVGEPIEEALTELADESSDARLATTLLAVHRRTGGDLPTLLDEVTDIVGRRTETRRQARALSAQARASGAVLAVLPVAFVGLLSGTSGDGLGAFYRTTTGSLLLLAGLALQGLGFVWLRRIARTGGSA